MDFSWRPIKPPGSISKTYKIFFCHESLTHFVAVHTNITAPCYKNLDCNRSKIHLLWSKNLTWINWRFQFRHLKSNSCQSSHLFLAENWAVGVFFYFHTISKFECEITTKYKYCSSRRIASNVRLDRVYTNGSQTFWLIWLGWFYYLFFSKTLGKGLFFFWAWTKVQMICRSEQ